MTMDINRRGMLYGFGALAGLSLGGCGSGTRLKPAGPASDSSRDWFDLGLIDDDVMNSQLLHFLATTYSGQADIGEVLETGTRIDAGDEWSWPREWIRTAERIEDMGDRSRRNRNRISAGKAYLRAANYYRAALIHHPDPAHPSVLKTGKRAVGTYDRAIALLQWSARPVRIPYEGTALPGYYFRPEKPRGEAPVLIFQQGRDAWPEETKHIVDDAVLRGYHCLIVHAPGQGMAIREGGLPFRPDWEHVIRPIIDFSPPL